MLAAPGRTMPAMSKTGERIKAARIAKGLTQAQAAQLVGISKQAFGQIESGKTKSPRPETLFLIADALGVPERELAAARPYSGESVVVSYMRSAREPDPIVPYKPAAPDHVEVPVFDLRAAAGPGAANLESALKGSLLFRKNSLRKKAISTSTSAVGYVRGESMLPRLRDGDSILFDRSDITIRSGRVYVFRFGDEVFVKRIFVDGSRLRVSSDNKSDPQWADWFIEASDHDLEVIGRVRWVGSWED